MNKGMRILILCIGLLSTATMQASQEGQDLGVCLSDSLNGKERKLLVRWTYFGLSTHSTIKPYSNISKADIDNTNKQVAVLMMRLITEDCPKEASTAYEANGSKAIEQAFGIVGQVAFQELMNEPSVLQSFEGYLDYIDEDKINKVFK
ncbi:hypothetical protein [Vibrio breoganii]|uniref:hypothetical protein n=1 Tax=Vibrio breoganii TaxID=553239 RepID=UPI0021C3FFAF|nr:hypothetical protein [Vibrio breoganii]MDN3717750.1 hypothetical protein [Vibrio breoganii]